MDTKCGIARVIIKKIKKKFTCLISDKNCQLLEKFSEQAINPRDEMLVEKILETGNKLWVDFATKSSIGDKDICNTTYNDIGGYHIKLNHMVIGWHALECNIWFWVQPYKSVTLGLGLNHIRLQHFTS